MSKKIMIVIGAYVLFAALAFADCFYIVEDGAECGHSYTEKPHCDTGCIGWRCTGPKRHQYCNVGETATEPYSDCEDVGVMQNCNKVQDHCVTIGTVHYCSQNPEIVLDSDCTECNQAATVSCNL